MLYPDEIVVYPDMSASPEQIQAQLEANRMAKLRHSARREQERMDAPSVFERMETMIKRIRAKRQKTAGR